MPISGYHGNFQPPLPWAVAAPDAERRWGGFFHTLSSAQTCSAIKPWQQRPPQNQKAHQPPRAVTVAACVPEWAPVVRNESSRNSSKQTQRNTAQLNLCRSGSSRGGMRPGTLPPTHSRSRNKLSGKRQQRPHKTKKTKSALILVASLQRRDGAKWELPRPPRAAD